MKRLVILAIIGVAGFFIYQYIQGTGPFSDKPMVAHGSEVFEEGAGIERVGIEGAFHGDDYIEPGQPTIIEFYSEICAGCKKLHEHYKKFLRIRPDVAVMQIRLDPHWRPQHIWEDHQVEIATTPHIIIYGPDGKLIAQDDGKDKSGFKFLYKWMNDEIQRDWKERER
jgi:hypothetical protein